MSRSEQASIRARAPGSPERSEDERSEPERSGGEPGARAAQNRAEESPSNEVAATPKRRAFTAQYKLAIVAEADAAKGSGTVAALLRREGLYSSHLTTWRKLRDAEAFSGLSKRRRGPKTEPVNPLARECDRLRRENARLAAELEQALTIVDIQKKVAGILAIPLRTPPHGGAGS